jgi:hypothetical protein
MSWLYRAAAVSSPLVSEQRPLTEEGSLPEPMDESFQLVASISCVHRADKGVCRLCQALHSFAISQMRRLYRSARVLSRVVGT